MKRLMVVIFTLTFASAAIAHSGGTNASGCHKNTKTGDYHCH